MIGHRRISLSKLVLMFCVALSLATDAMGQDKLKIYVAFTLQVPFCNSAPATLSAVIQALNHDKDLKFWEFTSGDHDASAARLDLLLKQEDIGFYLTMELKVQNDTDYTRRFPLRNSASTVSNPLSCDKWPTLVADGVLNETKIDSFRHALDENVTLGTEAQPVGKLEAVLPLDIGRFPEFLRIGSVRITFWKSGLGYQTVESSSIDCVEYPAEKRFNAIKVKHVRRITGPNQSIPVSDNDNFSELQQNRFSVGARLSFDIVCSGPSPVIIQ